MSKAKWCPQVRFHEVNGKVFHNKPPINDTDLGEARQDSALCITTDCALWEPGEFKLVTDNEGQRKNIMVGGHCGLRNKT